MQLWQRGLALAVVLPRAGNIGGGGFMIIHLKDKNETIAIDYREKAPSGAFRDLFLDEEGNYDKKKAQFSLLSAGVPGSVAGFHHALINYGTLSWEEILKPAIKLAEEGFEIPHDLANTLASKRYRAGCRLMKRPPKFFIKKIRVFMLQEKSLYKRILLEHSNYSANLAQMLFTKAR